MIILIRIVAIVIRRCQFERNIGRERLALKRTKQRRADLTPKFLQRVNDGWELRRPFDSSRTADIGTAAVVEIGGR